MTGTLLLVKVPLLEIGVKVGIIHRCFLSINSVLTIILRAHCMRTNNRDLPFTFLYISRPLINPSVLKVLSNFREMNVAARQFAVFRRFKHSLLKRDETAGGILTRLLQSYSHLQNR